MAEKSYTLTLKEKGSKKQAESLDLSSSEMSQIKDDISEKLGDGCDSEVTTKLANLLSRSGFKVDGHSFTVSIMVEGGLSVTEVERRVEKALEKGGLKDYSIDEVNRDW